MVKKTRGTQCKGRWCETHLFSMRPRLVLSDPSLEETIRFCPKFSKQKKRMERTLPQLNRDGKIYTPLFILEEDEVFESLSESLYSSHDERNKQIFQDNQQQQECEISQIMMPRVSSDRRHCKVCKAGYEEYQEHISSCQHRQALSTHPYSTLILDLTQNFKLNQHTNVFLSSTTPQLPQSLDSDLDSAPEKDTAPRDKPPFRKEDAENDI